MIIENFAAGAPDPLLDEDAAAAYLGKLSVRTLQRWRAERKGPPFVKIGRSIRYRKSGLDAFLSAGEQRPAA
jgi:hypothetical protein